MPLFRPCSLHCGLEISLDPLLALLAALRPHQVVLALSLRLGWGELVFPGPEIATPTPVPFYLDSFSDTHVRVRHALKYSLSGQSLDCLGQIWDKPEASHQPSSDESLNRGW